MVWCGCSQRMFCTWCTHICENQIINKSPLICLCVWMLHAIYTIVQYLNISKIHREQKLSESQLQTAPTNASVVDIIIAKTWCCSLTPLSISALLLQANEFVIYTAVVMPFKSNRWLRVYVRKLWIAVESTDNNFSGLVFNQYVLPFSLLLNDLIKVYL